MSRQCFFDAGAGSLRVGDDVVLPGAEARHASVKRIAVGEAIDVVDGAGTRLTCRVASATPELSLVVEAADVEPRPAVVTHLVQALSKGERDLQAVETCVEVGVDAVTPWQADRSIVRWRGDRAAKAHTKWVSQVLSALKQSRRAYLPNVGSLVDSADLVASTKAATEGGDLVLVLHEEATQGLPQVVRSWSEAGEGSLQREVTLVVGPEGGISPTELDGLIQAGATPVLLGKNVLRASTAGAVGLVLARQALGLYD